MIRCIGTKWRLLLIGYPICMFSALIVLVPPEASLAELSPILNIAFIPVWVGLFIWWFKTGFKDLFRSGDEKDKNRRNEERKRVGAFLKVTVAMVVLAIIGMGVFRAGYEPFGFAIVVTAIVVSIIATVFKLVFLEPIGLGGEKQR